MSRGITCIMILHFVEMFDVTENHKSFLAIRVNLDFGQQVTLINLYARVDSSIWFDKDNLGLTIVYIEGSKVINSK